MEFDKETDNRIDARAAKPGATVSEHRNYIMLRMAYGLCEISERLNELAFNHVKYPETPRDMGIFEKIAVDLPQALNNIADRLGALETLADR